LASDWSRGLVTLVHHGMRKGSLLKHGVELLVCSGDAGAKLLVCAGAAGAAVSRRPRQEVSLVKHGVQGVVNSVRVLDCGAGIEVKNRITCGQAAVDTVEFMRDDSMKS
jgi:hypothetical protein